MAVDKFPLQVVAGSLWRPWPTWSCCSPWCGPACVCPWQRDLRAGTTLPPRPSPAAAALAPGAPCCLPLRRRLRSPGGRLSSPQFLEAGSRLCAMLVGW